MTGGIQKADFLLLLPINLITPVNYQHLKLRYVNGFSCPSSIAHVQGCSSFVQISIMDNRIIGLHHITAIAGNARRNHDFYTRMLGLRLVKKTVNFDDPNTYHFYYGNESGTPGTILTFFPWEGINPGYTGTGMVTEISYAVPENSLPFWTERFRQHNIIQQPAVERFGEQILSFQDGDGLQLALVVPKNEDSRIGWATEEVPSSVSLKGFHHATLTLKQMDPTAAVLTDLFGYSLQQQEGSRYRFVTDAADTAHAIDIVAAPSEKHGYNAAGTNHHIAFRVRDEATLMAFREKIAARGFNITPKIDRNYFYSLYFREPGGVLFEIATDNPGFAIDEPLAELGTHLMLPPQYEKHRLAIERQLPLLA